EDEGHASQDQRLGFQPRPCHAQPGSESTPYAMHNFESITVVAEIPAYDRAVSFRMCALIGSRFGAAPFSRRRKECRCLQSCEVGCAHPGTRPSLRPGALRLCGKLKRRFGLRVSRGPLLPSCNGSAAEGFTPGM